MDWTKHLGANHANHLQRIPIKPHRVTAPPPNCMPVYWND